MAGKTHLVIGDPHATPSHHNERFTILGKFIIDRKPDVVINIGDMADMASLCSYDRGKKSFEGRRYKKDIEATIDAQEKMFAPINAYNAQKRKNKEKQYKPKYHLTLGNHENRIKRAVEDQAELEGVISTDDLKFKEFGWKVHPFLETAQIDGVCYSHYFTSGVMGRPIGGEHPAASLLAKLHTSAIQGHSHLRDYSEKMRGDGKKIQAIVAGCYLDVDQYEDYAGPANQMWSKGLVMLHDVHEGQFEPEFISMKQLRENYNA